MKALSLWQPWASAMAAGSKKIETRHWELPKSAIGVPVAIHAAKQWSRLERELAELFMAEGLDLGFTDVAAPPLGCIVAVARFTGCLPSEQVDFSALNSHEWMLGNYATGRYAWITSAVVRLPEPIPCLGRQGFWSLDAPTVSAAWKQICDLAGVTL